MLVRIAVLLALPLAWPLSLCAFQTNDQPPAAKPVVTMPALISKQEPTYSEEARDLKIQGKVLLNAVVDEAGIPTNVEVLRGLGSGLDEQASAALQTWRFRPGTNDGRPVPVKTAIEVSFRLEGAAGGRSQIRVSAVAPADRWWDAFRATLALQGLEGQTGAQLSERAFKFAQRPRPHASGTSRRVEFQTSPNDPFLVQADFEYAEGRPANLTFSVDLCADSPKSVKAPYFEGGSLNVLFWEVAVSPRYGQICSGNIQPDGQIHIFGTVRSTPPGVHFSRRAILIGSERRDLRMPLPTRNVTLRSGHIATDSGFESIRAEMDMVAGGFEVSDTTYFVYTAGQLLDWGLVVGGADVSLDREVNIQRINLAHQPYFGGPPVNPGDERAFAPYFADASEAPVNLVVYGDFQCSFCREEAEIVRKNVPRIFGNKVRVFYKDYPLQAIHSWALAGSMAGRCVYRQDPGKYWTFFDWIYAAQNEIDDNNLGGKVRKWGGENGLDAAQLDTCLTTKATSPEIMRSMEDNGELRIRSVPTLFLNGRRMLGAVPWTELEKAIKVELDRAAAQVK